MCTINLVAICTCVTLNVINVLPKLAKKNADINLMNLRYKNKTLAKNMQFNK